MAEQSENDFSSYKSTRESDDEEPPSSSPTYAPLASPTSNSEEPPLPPAPSQIEMDEMHNTEWTDNSEWVEAGLTRRPDCLLIVHRYTLVVSPSPWPDAASPSPLSC